VFYFCTLPIRSNLLGSDTFIYGKVDGGGSVTLKEFTATTFHINDETYKISGNKFVKKF